MPVCMQWPDQIHANDSILTFGYSETVLVFLLEAAKKLDFQARPPSHVILHVYNCKCTTSLCCFMSKASGTSGV